MKYILSMARLVKMVTLFIQWGVIVPLHALRLPDEPIKDVGEYWCEVTVRHMASFCFCLI